MIRICKSDGCGNECSFHHSRGTYNSTSCEVCDKLRREYNITKPQRDKLLELQENECAICGTFVEFGKNLKGKTVSAAVDHCHNDGGVRGILCGNCNMGIGQLKDDINILKNAITYLETYNERLN